MSTLTQTDVHEILDGDIDHFGIILLGDLAIDPETSLPRLYSSLRGAKIARSRLFDGDGEIVEVVIKTKPIAKAYQTMVNG